MSEFGKAQPTSAWSPIAVLPNIEVQTPKLAGPHIALIGASDSCYEECIHKHPDLRMFPDSFTGSHGETVRPSLMACQS